MTLIAHYYSLLLVGVRSCLASSTRVRSSTASRSALPYNYNTLLISPQWRRQRTAWNTNNCADRKSFCSKLAPSSYYYYYYYYYSDSCLDRRQCSQFKSGNCRNSISMIIHNNGFAAIHSLMHPPLLIKQSSTTAYCISIQGNHRRDRSLVANITHLSTYFDRPDEIGKFDGDFIIRQRSIE